MPWGCAKFTFYAIKLLYNLSTNGNATAELTMNHNSQPKLELPQPMDYKNFESLPEKIYGEQRSIALSLIDAKLVAESPMVYLDRRLVTLLLTRIKMFEKVIDVQGSIVECGVHRGNSGAV